MQAIKYIMITVLLYAGSVSASENVECLKHLGGGMSDIACYQELTLQESKKIDGIVLELLKTIPKRNKVRDVFNKNVKENKYNTIEFCNIKRLAANTWEKEDSDGMSEHRYTDVIYYECLYNLTKKTVENFTSLLNEYKHSN